MSDAAESYKTLRVRLLHEANERRLKTVVVTSSLDGEGKTSTTANLGVALAVGGKRTVVVSADLRRPILHDYFSAERTPGLADVITGNSRPFDALGSTSTPDLWLLTSGSHSESVGPLDMLGSDGMRKVLAQLSNFADFVLIDTPPLLRSPDVAALARLVDGALLVADSRRVDRVTVEHAHHELHLMHVPIVGVVVNNFTRRRFRMYGAGYGRSRYSTNGTERAPVEASPGQHVLPAGRDGRTDE